MFLADVGIREYLFYLLYFTCGLHSRLVVNDTYGRHTSMWVGNTVKSVDNTAYAYLTHIVVSCLKSYLCVDGILQCKNVEGSDTLVAMQQLPQILYQHLAVYQMQTIVVRTTHSVLHLEELLIESTVYDILQQSLSAKILLYRGFLYPAVVVANDVVVYQLCRLVEYVSEHTVVNHVVFAVRFLYVSHMLIEEQQLTLYVSVYSRRRQALHAVELLLDAAFLVYALWLVCNG